MRTSPKPFGERVLRVRLPSEADSRSAAAADGRRLAFTFAGTYRRILIPLLGELARYEPSAPPRPLALASRRLEREFNRFVEAVAA